MPAPQAFLDRWLGAYVQRATLVEVQLTSPSSRTLRFATRALMTPDGNLWEPALLGFGAVNDPGSLVDALSEPATTSFQLDSSLTLGFQGSGKRVPHLFKDFRWIGATIIMRFWPLGYTGSLSDGQIFKGVVQRYAAGHTKCEV